MQSAGAHRPRVIATSPSSSGSGYASRSCSGSARRASRSSESSERSKAVAVLLLAYAVYIALVVGVASAIGAWNTGLLKETIAWLLVPGIVLLFGFSKAYEGRRFYVRTLIRVIGLTALIEFYVNLSAFPLWVELVLLPLTVFLVALSTVAGMKPSAEIVKRWVDRLTAVLGLVVLAATGIYLASEWSNLDQAELALSFAQPVWLTLASLPFIFAFSLFANYETHFVRIGFYSHDDPERRRRAKSSSSSGASTSATASSTAFLAGHSRSWLAQARGTRRGGSSPIAGAVAEARRGNGRHEGNAPRPLRRREGTDWEGRPSISARSRRRGRRSTSSRSTTGPSSRTGGTAMTSCRWSAGS